MLSLFALALAVAPMQLQTVDVPQIVKVVLDTLVPPQRLVNTATGLKRIEDVTLVLDVERSTAAFRMEFDQRSTPAPDYADVNRAFVARTYDEVATPCATARSRKCNLVGGILYASVVRVEANTNGGGYKITVLVLWPGRQVAQGAEQEVFVSKRNNAWHFDRLGIVRVFN